MAAIHPLVGIGAVGVGISLLAEEGAIAKNDQLSNGILQGHIHLINFASEGEIEKQTPNSPNEEKDEDTGRAQTPNKPPKTRKTNTEISNQVSEEIAEVAFHQVRREQGVKRKIC